MADAKPKKTQETPKGHEIPVPSKEDVLRVLEKMADDEPAAKPRKDGDQS